MTKIEKKLITKRRFSYANQITKLVFDTKFLRAYNALDCSLHTFYHDLERLDTIAAGNCLYDYLYFRRIFNG